LPFQSSLLGQGSLESIPVWPVVDFKQQFALLYELIVTHIQPGYGTLYLERDPDEIRKYLGIIGSRVAVRPLNHR
jgi:hypothetical protein